MSTTSYFDIFDLFLNKINDYYIKSQLVLNVDLANEILLGYLKSAIPKFTYCTKNLTERDDDLYQFNIQLSDIEKEILSMLMIVEHLSPKIVRDEYLENHLGSKDYNEFSPANQLKQLQDLSANTSNSANLLMIEYYYRQDV